LLKTISAVGAVQPAVENSFSIIFQEAHVMSHSVFIMAGIFEPGPNADFGKI